MADWTYGSQIDLTNGGLDDQEYVTIASGLPSGIVELEVFFHSVSSDTDSRALCVQMGDAGGFENTGYLCRMQNGVTGGSTEEGVVASRNSPVAAADSLSGVMCFYRWDSSEHLWHVTILSHESGSSQPRHGNCTKTLSGELTQLRAVADFDEAGALFDGGEIRARYR
jgi:hypothetical protein